MYKGLASLAGVAGATALFLIAAPAPADASAARHLSGAATADQANVQEVQYRYRRAYRRYPYRYRYGYRRAYPYPYPYAYPYPYYQPSYYAPGAYIRFGPFGLGIW
jgi:hypothetical protein